MRRIFLRVACSWHEAIAEVRVAHAMSPSTIGLEPATRLVLDISVFHSQQTKGGHRIVTVAGVKDHTGQSVTAPLFRTGHMIWSRVITVVAG